MFQLFKKRTFGEYISDTFSFFKVTGKHYFKNYIVINGGFLLILMVFFYFVFKVYFEFLFANIGGNSNSFVDNFFNNNIGLIITVVITMIFLMLLITAISYAFPVLYLKLYDQNKGNNFTTADLFSELKKNFKKIIIFILALFGLSITAGIIIFGIAMLLVMVIIGIPILFILLPATIAIVNISFYHYLTSEIGVFDAFLKGIEYLKQNFWPIVGSTVVIYFIIQIITTIFTMVPYVFMMAQMFTNAENMNQTDSMSTMTIMLVIIFCVSIVFTYILNNLLMVNAGIMYYSIREQNENNNTKSDIDSIGTE